MTLGRATRRWAVIGAILLMVAVPAAALFEPRPARFGWQMFTAMAPVPAAWVERDDGTEEPIDVESRLVQPRPEADIRGALADVLCREPGVTAIVVETLEARRRLEC